MLASERRISTQLKSWLRAVNIPYEDKLTHLVVTKNDSSKMPVYFSGSQTDGIVINRSKLINRNLQLTLDYFSNLQKELGYNPINPVNRGVVDGKSNDWDLVVMKHMDFRRSPNPDPNKIKRYQYCIDIACRMFYKNNINLLENNMMELEDLQSYAQVWTINFTGLYELPADDDQNPKLLMEYLKQRFQDFKKMLKKRNRNELVEIDTPTLPEISMGMAVQSDNVSNTEIKKTKLNKSEIDNKLNALGHDKMVEMLMAACENTKIHPDAKALAGKKLHKHVVKCEQCKDLDLSQIAKQYQFTTRPIKDQNGAIYDSPADAGRKLNLFPSNIRNVLLGRYSHTGGYSFTYAPN